MNTLQTILTVVGGLVTLAGLAGLLYVAFTSSAKDARIKTLEGQRDDYLSRLNYIEPKAEQLKEQVDALVKQHDYSPRFDRIEEALRAVKVTVDEIDDKLPHRRGTSG